MCLLGHQSNLEREAAAWETSTVTATGFQEKAEILHELVAAVVTSVKA